MLDRASSKYNKLCIIAAYIYLAISIIGTFFVTPVVLNQIGDNRYGLFSFCNSITTWLATLSTALGSSYVFFKRKDIEENNSDKKINSIYFKLFLYISLAFLLILSISLPILYFCDIPFINYSLDDSKIIYLLLFISGINVCITILTSVFYLFLVSKKEFLFLRIKNILLSILMYSFNVLFACLTKSIVAIAFVVLFLTIIGSSFNIYCCLKTHNMTFEKKLQFSDNRLLTKRIFTYSLFVLINTIVSTINNNLDKTILGIFVNSESVTYYSLAFSFVSYLTFAIAAVSETYMPIFYDLYNQQKNDEINKLFKKIYTIQLFLITLFVFGFLSCGYEFVEIWVGKERIQVFYYAATLILLSYIPLTSYSCIDCERAMNKHKFRATIMLIFTLINVLISIILVLVLDKTYAIWACIIGTAFSKIVSECVILLIYDSKIIKLDIGTYLINALKYIIFGVLSSLLPILFHFLFKTSFNIYVLFVVEVIAFIVIYIGLLLIFDRNILKTIFLKERKK